VPFGANRIGVRGREKTDREGSTAMAQAAEQYDVRRELLDILLTNVANDRHPSATMMDLIEQLIGPEERPIYVQVLLDKLRQDRHPSIPMMRRIMALS
jgi:hypothetical protein